MTAYTKILTGPMAEDLLNAPTSGLNSRFGSLTLTNPKHKNQFLSLINDATRHPARGGAMALNGIEPSQLYVIPLSASSALIQDWQKPLALVLVTDGNKASSQLTLVGQIYGLTQAELRVASALLAGKAPEDCALEFGVTINTVRTQLKSLFAKTGTRRQSELVAMLGRTPPLKL